MRGIRLLVVLLFVFNASCASVGVRMGAYSHRATVYPATAVDFGLISQTTQRLFNSDSSAQSDPQDGIGYALTPVALIDAPFALAIDTLMLPYDLHQRRQKMNDSVYDDELTPATLKETPPSRQRHSRQ